MKKLIKNKYAYLTLFFILAFVNLALFFSIQQSLWVDEATQLSGLSLSFIDVYLWLGGFIENPFLVPGDRMPVLSYWVGKVWVFFTNSDVITLRWLSIIYVTVAISILARYLIINKLYKVLLACLVFLCLSPNLVIFAVEIRAYSLFFLLATISSVLYMDIIRSREKGVDVYKKMIFLLIVLALSINTHIYGLLLSGSIAGSYIILVLTDKRFSIDTKLIITVVIIFSLSILAVSPSIYASFAMTSQVADIEQSASSLKSAIKLIYRLVSHQSMMEVFFIPIMALIVFYGVIVFSLFRKLELLKKAIILVLFLGFLVAFLAQLLLTGFNALSISYNIWMLPFIAILFGLSVSDLSSFKQQSVVVILLGSFFVYGQYNLLVSGEKYAHTRFNEIESRASKYSKEQPVAIIYNGDMAKTWFAGIFKLKTEVGQYIPIEGGYKNLKTGLKTSQEDIESRFGVVMSIYGEDKSSKELVSLESQAPIAPNSPALAQINLSESLWDVKETTSFFAHESADIIVYRKKNKQAINVN